ncbi:MAG: SDR family NAD(P)-dependent oxidoreductase [Bacteroidota bacterium]
MVEFEGKVAIVTGAGQGIGLEVCRQLMAGGCSVILNDLEETLTREATDDLNKSGNGRCIGVAGDASQMEVIMEIIETASTRFGRIDMVMANAGVTLFGDFLTYTLEDFRKVIGTNLESAFFLTQQAALQMCGQRGGGSILLMSSVTAHQAHHSLAAYAMTKAATEMLARNLVPDLAPHGIRINAIAPGATLTERTQQDKTYDQVWSGLTPLGRPAAVSDVASAAIFLLSDKSRHITGQTLVVDGGWTVVSPQP